MKKIKFSLVMCVVKYILTIDELHTVNMTFAECVTKGSCHPQCSVALRTE